MITRRLLQHTNFSDAFTRYLDGYGEQFQPSLDIAVRNITFVVTEACNLECSYCYLHNKSHSNIMTKEIAKQAVDAILFNPSIQKYIDPSGQTRAVILDFIGGEPLLQIDLISYICDYFRYQVFTHNHKYQNYMISMSSNGVLYDGPSVQRFIKKNRPRLSLSITIDGNKELHDSCRKFPDGSGSFDVVYKNVQFAIKQIGLKSTKVTLAPDNLKYLYDNVIWLFETCGIPDVPANPVFETGWKKEHAILYYRELMKLADWMLEDKRYDRYSTTLLDEYIGNSLTPEDNNNWCGGTGAMLAVGTDGNLYPCIRYMRYSLDNDRQELKIGDIWNGIASIPDEQKVLDCLSCITRRSQSTDECFNCPVASGCAWCSGYNYDYFGTPDKRATFICDMHKARVLANYYYWNMRYKLDSSNEHFKLNLSEEDINFISGGKQIRRFE